MGSARASAPQESAWGGARGSVSARGQGPGRVEWGPATPGPHNNSDLPASSFVQGPRGPALTLIRMTTPASGLIGPDVLFCLGGGVGKAWGWRSGPWTAQ